MNTSPTPVDLHRKEMEDLLKMVADWRITNEDELRETNMLFLVSIRPRLCEIPHPVFSLINLVRLYIAGNEIEFVPDTISHLKNLEWLSLWSNRISSLPESIGELRELKDLILCRNRLQRIPESIGRLSNLSLPRSGGSQNFAGS